MFPEERENARMRQFHTRSQDPIITELPKLRLENRTNLLETTRKKELYDFIDFLIENVDIELKQKQFNNFAIQHGIRADLLEDLYKDYITKRRTIKATAFVIQDDVIPIRLSTPKRKTKTDFNIARQVKNYGLFTNASGPNHFQMDIFYVKSDDGERAFQLSYLVIIGVNNRFACVEPTNTFISSDAIAVSHSQKDINAVEIAIDKCLEILPLIPKHKLFIDCDGEKAFVALKPDWLAKRKIIMHAVPDKFHYRLSIVNRFIRTIRDKAKRFYDITYIQPDLMRLLVEEYNDEPHTTLSQLMGFRVSPNMIVKDYEMEAFISKKLRILNLKMEQQRHLENGTKVSVMLPDFHQKFRREDGYEIVGKEAAKLN
jgi:hypothetical protein